MFLFRQHSEKVPAVGPGSRDGDPHYVAPSSFPIGPFTRYRHNPVLAPDPARKFEEAYIYNAAAIVVEDRVFLLYRAQDRAKVSSIGLAWSSDGYNFSRHHEPVLRATEPWEQGGGCEDPRVVRDPCSRKFIMTYTAYDRTRARLCVAESYDLVTWIKHPPVVADDSWAEVCTGLDGERFIRRGWSKSGAVFVDRHTDGKHYMIWGEAGLQLATSDDMVHWEIQPRVFARGTHSWESRLIEPGPPPIRVDTGNSKKQYILFYNASTVGGGRREKGTYSISQMLIDYDRLEAGPVARLDSPVLEPESAAELGGQVARVVFTEGVVQFRGQWLLYYGQGDSFLGVATCDAEGRNCGPASHGCRATNQI